MSNRVRIGVLRLVDSAPVIVARERHLFHNLGLHCVLSIEPSWANIADKMAYGLLDAAVILPPLALALSLGLREPAVKLIVPMGLSQGGNTIVLGGEMTRNEAAQSPGTRLSGWLARRGPRPRIGVVHQFSTHNLLLRYWLALTGIDPDRDIETVVVTPEQVVRALSDRRISGFCAGAPWGVAAEQAGVGTSFMGLSEIWPFHPEKCLAVRADWACEQPEALIRLMRALIQAQVICDLPAEADSIAASLAVADGLAQPRDAVRAGPVNGSGFMGWERACLPGRMRFGS